MSAATRISIEYYDVDGNRCLSKDGYAKATSKYDDSGHQTQQVEFDLTGKSTVKIYDARGDQVEEAYFDEKGVLSPNSDGITRWTASYSDGSDPTNVTCFDHDGKPTAVEICLTEILPEGQAKEAGLSKGDVVASYDGKLISNYAEFLAWLRTSGDATRELVVLRGNLRLSFALKPGKLGALLKARIPRTPSVLRSDGLHR
jgi:hypothetical protein